MQAPVSHAKFEGLIACGPLRAWSVVVTILGDLCRAPDDRISGRALNALTGHMGLSAATVRVALHRLKRDGWIESERRGRDAAYRLSRMGRAETDAVRDRIYAHQPTTAGQRRLHLLVAPPDLPAAGVAAALPAGAVLVAPRTALLADTPRHLPPGFLAATVDPGAAPGWLADAVLTEGLRQDYAALARAVSASLAGPPPADATEAAALRLLALHHWRRLRLRHGDLPDMLLGEAWEGAAARRAVMAALDRFPRPQPADLAA